MNWDALGAIAETLGVLVVIASLIYIAIQIRQNSSLLQQNLELARAAMIHETNDSATRFSELIAQDDELASIYQRGVSGGRLNETETARYIALAEVYLTWLEDIDSQHQAGLFIDEEDDPDPVADIRPHYAVFLGRDIVRDWWFDGARFFFSRRFREKFEKIMADVWSAAD